MAIELGFDSIAKMEDDCDFGLSVLVQTLVA